MSTRVKVLFQHPDQMPATGIKAFRVVEERFETIQARRVHPHITPPGFVGWPRWKRCLWMARKLGDRWHFRVFRERRNTRIRKSLFWKAAMAIGLQPKQKLKKLNPRRVERPRPGRPGGGIIARVGQGRVEGVPPEWNVPQQAMHQAVQQYINPAARAVLEAVPMYRGLDEAEPDWEL